MNKLVMFNDFSSLDFLSGIMHIQYFILNLGLFPPYYVLDHCVIL